MAEADTDRLKLRARDHEDFRVLSSVLQDALLPVRDMTRLTREKRFVLIANRFRWEARAAQADLPDQPRPAPPEAAHTGDARFEDGPLYERIQAGVTFDRVAGVRYRGFRLENTGTVLNLLAVLPDQDGITLQCAGAAGIYLKGRRVVCHLEDIGEPWPTHWRPSHAAASQSSSAAGTAQSTSEDT